MKKKISENPQILDHEQAQLLLAFAKDQRLNTIISTLIDRSDEWDIAMTDPSSWLQAQGVKLPEGLSVVITKNISISKPVDTAVMSKPGPDWVPHEIIQSNCRTYWIGTTDEDGKPSGIREETICMEFKIVPNKLPGPFG